MISQIGIDLIKKWEGFSVMPYKDAGGKATVGYGHLIKAGENFDKGISFSEAEMLLLDDVVEAEKAVVRLLDKVPLSGSQCDALTSFVETGLCRRRGAIPALVLRQQKGKRRAAEQAAGRNAAVYEGITLENRKGMCL